MKRDKVCVVGSRPDVRVPFAEVPLGGDNPPVRLYDTSGPGSSRRCARTG
jgi:phosphomethylpyrimidine synthase